MLTDLHQVPHVWEPASLQIVRRIFDPADYLWLKDTLKAPSLAREMELVRKNLAMRWLSQAEADFRELIRTFREGPGTEIDHGPVSEMSLLRHSASVHALLILARVSVSMLGPFNSLSNTLVPLEYLGLLRSHPILADSAASLSRNTGR